MKTQAQVLMKKAKDMPECTEGLENLQSSIDRATMLVNQLLSLARLQKDDFPMSQMNLSECLYDSIDDFRSAAQQKDIKIEIDIAEDVFITGHELSIAILIKNLLDNSIKYTPDNGCIFVNLSAEGLLEISDTGPGISNADKAKAFDRFVRLDKSGQTGSGLGLSIASWIASAHNVVIALQNNEPQGLKVTLQWKLLCQPNESCT